MNSSFDSYSNVFCVRLLCHPGRATPTQGSIKGVDLGVVDAAPHRGVFDIQTRVRIIAVATAFQAVLRGATVDEAVSAASCWNQAVKSSHVTTSYKRSAASKHAVVESTHESSHETSSDKHSAVSTADSQMKAKKKSKKKKKRSDGNKHTEDTAGEWCADGRTGDRSTRPSKRSRIDHHSAKNDD